MPLKYPAVNTCKKKMVIGILGGIGSGKTTVANCFQSLGCRVISADKLAHEFLTQTPVIEQLVKKFGAKITSDNKIDRSQLAKIAFASEDNLSYLNKTLHPLVLGKVEDLMEQYQGDPEAKAIVLDLPLLMEIDWHKRCDKLIFVDSTVENRLKRTSISAKQLKIRENFQISLDSKVSIADDTVVNNSDIFTLTKQVKNVFFKLI